MKLYLEPVSAILSLTAGSTTGISQLKLKRGDYVALEIVADLPSTATGIFAAKASIGGEPVLLFPTWSAPLTLDAGFIFALSLTTTELDALFAGGATTVTLLGEITWTVGGHARSTPTFNLIVDADVWRGDEAIPTPANVLMPAVIIVSSAPTTETDFFMFPGGVAPTFGSYEFQDDRFLYKIKGGQTLWRRTPISQW